MLSQDRAQRILSCCVPQKGIRILSCCVPQMSLPLGPGRNEFGPAVVRVRAAKSAVAGDHFLHAHFVGWQTAIVRKEISLTSARAPRHLSGFADAKVEQHCHRYGHYDET